MENKKHSEKNINFPFDIEFVLEMNIPDYPKYRNADPNEIQTDCPLCDKKGKLYINKYKNTFYCQHCKEYGGMLELHRKLNSFTTTKEAYKDLYAKFKQIPEDRRRVMKEVVRLQENKVIETNVADVQRRNHCYQKMLKNCSLSIEDRTQLIRRGLSLEAINHYQIVSTPVLLKTLAERMIADSEDELIQRTKQIQTLGSDIPGVYPTDDGLMFVKLKPGIMIPVLDKHGLISMFQIRYHDLKPLRNNATQKEKDAYQIAKNNYHKYAQLSSGYMIGGCGTYGIDKVHHIGFDFKSGKTPYEVCLTEGCLKADVASYLGGGTAYLAILGVNNTNQLYDEFEWLKQNGTKRLRVRFDMDFKTNSAVRQAIYEANAIAQQMGYNPVIYKPSNPSTEWLELYEIYKKLMLGMIDEKKRFTPLKYTVIRKNEDIDKFEMTAMTDIWKGSLGKGIDDYLLNGGK